MTAQLQHLINAAGTDDLTVHLADLLAGTGSPTDTGGTITFTGPLDLKSPDACARAHRLARQADIFVENYRGRKLAQFGLSPEQLAEIHPGIVVVSVRCYGWDGPRAQRGGFDILETAASGLAMLEGANGIPSVPPTALINDDVTGYMGVAGATAALIRRAQEGSYHVTVSLTRNAIWCQSLGLVRPDERAFAENPFHHLDYLNPGGALPFLPDLKQRLLDTEVLIRETPLGRVRRLAPAVTCSATPASWNDPILVPMGASSPSWLSATGC